MQPGKVGASPGDPASVSRPDLPILVVDDEPTARSSFALLFEARGYNVVEAADGPEALEVLRARRVALVFTDLHLPGFDGDELQDRTVDLLGSGAPPFVLATADDAWVHRFEGDGSFVAVFEKPVPTAEVLQTVEDALDASRG